MADQLNKKPFPDMSPSEKDDSFLDDQYTASTSKKDFLKRTSGFTGFNSISGNSVGTPVTPYVPTNGGKGNLGAGQKPSNTSKGGR